MELQQRLMNLEEQAAETGLLKARIGDIDALRERIEALEAKVAAQALQTEPVMTAVNSTQVVRPYAKRGGPPRKNREDK